MHHPLAERQFTADLEFLKSASACVLVLPCGRSAHTEPGGWQDGARMSWPIPEDGGAGADVQAVR